jgi:hypothetical protein
VRLDTGEPLRGVHVSMTASGVRELPTGTTDDAGRFELTGLVAARYTLTATKTGFVSLQYGQRRPNQPGQPLDVADGEVLESIDLGLPRGAAVEGLVLDRAGDPVTGASVQLLRHRWVSGRRQLMAGVASMDRTDDTGQFRLHGIAPGTYVLSASVNTRPPSQALDLFWSVGIGSATTFYPGAASATEAQPVELALGQELIGVVITLVPARVATISGTVRGEDGQLVSSGSVSLTQPIPFSGPGSTSSTSVAIGPDGTFRAPYLPPGRYSVSARPPAPSGNAPYADVILDGAEVWTAGRMTSP